MNGERTNIPPRPRPSKTQPTGGGRPTADAQDRIGSPSVPLPSSARQAKSTAWTGEESLNSPGFSSAGVALPTVLLCLLVLAALLTGLMLTTSTELAISLAHGDAVEDRYLAEGAIHAWTAHAGEDLEPIVLDDWSPAGSGALVRIIAERLATRSHDDNSLFSIRATPLRGGRAGRSSLALVRTRPVAPDTFQPVITATITSSGGGRVVSSWPGSPTILDDSADGTVAEYAFLHAVGTAFEVVHPASLSGDVHTSQTESSLLDSVLGGHRIRDLAWNADVRFGRYFNEPALKPPEDRPWSAGRSHDWGCPSGLLSSLPAGDVGSCTADTETDGWRMIAIDAQNDTVRLTDHHGQGVLMVVNGHLHIDGAFAYRGLILVDGSVILSGGGASWPPSVTGAIVAVGPVMIFDGRDPGGWTTTDRRVVRFDHTAVQTAVATFNDAGPGRWSSRRVQGRPHAWIEVME
jgi:hypothetical protein